MILNPPDALLRRRIAANTALASALIVCGALLLFPPARIAMYPQCPIREYLGLLCPGCGATRAFGALLRGRLSEAIQQNALFVLLLPLGLAAVVRTYLRAVRPGEFRWPRIPAPALATMLLSAAAFAIGRNLPR